MSPPRPIPLLGDISLDCVVQVEHLLDGGFVPTRVVALAGEVQQRSGRPSHRVYLAGELFGEQAAEQLGTLQAAAADGAELTFAADIASALDLQRVVIARFRAAAVAGVPDRYWYELHLVESPPLPPPAQVESFGGLDDFGVGDLGFDTDILADLEAQAGELAGAVDGALEAVEQLQSLTQLAGGLDLGDAGGLLAPLETPVRSVGELGSDFRGAADDLGTAFGGPP
jgi:hypothetical protein